MVLGYMEYLYQNPIFLEYLRYNPKWYRVLYNRPEAFNSFMNEARTNLKLRTVDKLDSFNNKISFISKLSDYMIKKK